MISARPLEAARARAVIGCSAKFRIFANYEKLSRTDGETCQLERMSGRGGLGFSRGRHAFAS
jgi:hypothetical protein